MGSIGMSELIVILLVALLVFGAKRLPEMARSLGQGMMEFKKATREISRELTSYEAPPLPPRPAPPPASTATPAPEKQAEPT